MIYFQEMIEGIIDYQIQDECEQGVLLFLISLINRDFSLLMVNGEENKKRKGKNMAESIQCWG